MENARDFVMGFRERGDSSKKSTRSESKGTAQLATTPPDSSRNTSKPSLQSSLLELQLMLGPETLQLCQGLDDLNRAVGNSDLEKLMLAVRKIKAANSSIEKTCTAIESKLFELKDPTWSRLKA